MKKVLVLSFSELTYDARVTRQVRWLCESHEVTVVCFDKPASSGNPRYLTLEKLPLPFSRKLLLGAALLLRLYRLAYRVQFGYYPKVRSHLHQPYDVIIANDIETLPLAFRLSLGAKVIFDAHEYAPRHFEDKRIWRLLFGPFNQYLCRKYIPKTHAMATVCQGLADEYFKHFHKPVSVITNATRYHDLSPGEVSSEIRLVHHGIINRSRKIERMIEVMSYLGEGYVLDLIFKIPEYASPGTIRYYRELEEMIGHIPNVNLLPPLENDVIVQTINAYDIGLFLLEPVNFNYKFALPNKLFDFIQARLAIAIGPSVEMQKIVNAYGIGVVSKDFTPTEMAKAIKRLRLQDITEKKHNCHTAAAELSEEQNKTRFLALLND